MSRATWPYIRMALNNVRANAVLCKALSGLGAEGFAAERPGFSPSLEFEPAATVRAYRA